MSKEENRFSKFFTFISIMILAFSNLQVEAKENEVIREEEVLETDRELGEYFLDSVPAIEYTEDEVQLLATVIYAEAGICDNMEKYRVGNVVLNRVEDSTTEFKNTVKDVIYQEGQFTSVGSSNWKHGPTEEEKAIAKNLLDGMRVFPSYVVWFAKKSSYGKLYYTSEWHEFSGWEEEIQTNEEENLNVEGEEPKKEVPLLFSMKE